MRALPILRLVQFLSLLSWIWASPIETAMEVVSRADESLMNYNLSSHHDKKTLAKRIILNYNYCQNSAFATALELGHSEAALMVKSQQASTSQH